jgi:hypothetical protein
LRHAGKYGLYKIERNVEENLYEVTANWGRQQKRLNLGKQIYISRAKYIQRLITDWKTGILFLVKAFRGVKPQS